jgi:hypothetical protein
MGARDVYDCTPQQYHAQLDKLWAALPDDWESVPGEWVQDKIVSHIQSQAETIEALQAWKAKAVGLLEGSQEWVFDGSKLAEQIAAFLEEAKADAMAREGITEQDIADTMPPRPGDVR